MKKSDIIPKTKGEKISASRANTEVRRAALLELMKSLGGPHFIRKKDFAQEWGVDQDTVTSDFRAVLAGLPEGYMWEKYEKIDSFFEKSLSKLDAALDAPLSNSDLARITVAGERVASSQTRLLEDYGLKKVVPRNFSAVQFNQLNQHNPVTVKRYFGIDTSEYMSRIGLDACRYMEADAAASSGAIASFTSGPPPGYSSMLEYWDRIKRGDRV